MTGRRRNARTYIETHTDPAVKRIVLLAARAVLSPELGGGWTASGGR